MRYNLVDGQGNFGSIDGDNPAAMRYTEARLTHASVALMEDLDKDTVEMVPNYDETKKEPVVFPAKFPNLICNGSSGIAVGMATNIPPHNLLELIKATLLVLDRPETSIDEIMQVMPAPDFPTGGVIFGYRGIKEAYHTGRGKLLLRAKIEVEQDKKTDRERLVVTEIPYNINKSRLIEQIADLVNEKTIPGISDIRDDSDKDGLRLVLELKKNEFPEVIMNQLYKYSDLSTTFGCNLLALDKGLPRLLNIKQMIACWIEHRIEVIRRRTRFELNKAHVLEGYLKAIDSLDEVVKLIRASSNREEAKKGLIEQFTFTDRQAHAVLDLRLYQLTGLERDKIEAEHNELLKKIAYYRQVLADEGLVRTIIREELQELEKNHKSPRKTVVVPMEGEMQMEDLIANDSVIITLSTDDYIKRMPIDTFREQRRGGAGVTGVKLKKENDAIKGVYLANAHDTLMLFTNKGRCYWIKAWQIPEGTRQTKGKPLVNLIEGLQQDEKPTTVLTVDSFQKECFLFMITRRGVVKKCQLSDFSNVRRKGIIAIDLDEGDSLLSAHLVTQGQQMMLFTRFGMAVRFDEEDVRTTGRTARGVRGVNLKEEGDVLVSSEVVNGDESILVVCENGYGKRSLVDDFRKTYRGGVGVRSIVTSDRNGLVVGAQCVTDKDSLLLVSQLGQTVRIPIEQIRVLGRNTQGVKLLNLKESDKLIDIQKLDVEEAAVGAEEPVET